MKPVPKRKACASILILEVDVSDEQPFWHKPLEQLSTSEWESLCDGCGRCCLHKLEDEDSGEIYSTNVACRLLNLRSGRCGRYAQRHRYVPDCVCLTPELVRTINWLPYSCAYRCLAEGRELPAWHPLVSGDASLIHKVGASVRGWVVSEKDVQDLEGHILEAEPPIANDWR